MPVVSIVVPVYKVEEYIRHCLDSILAQTFSDFEVILVDDGSPDSCGAICDEYAREDNRIRVIHQENSGVSRARNAALDQVTGKYVTFCDSDDRYEMTWLQCLVTAMEVEGADMVLGGIVKVLEDKILFSVHHEPEVVDTASINQKIDYCAKKILNHIHGWEVCARLFRMDIIRENQIRFCQTCQNFAEDMGFVLEYTLYTARVAVIAEAGYIYRERSGSMMNTSVGKVKLNSVNEVALQVLQRFDSCFFEAETKRIQPVLHYLIMNNQYEKLIAVDQYRQFRSYVKQIRRYDTWKSWSWKLFACRKELQALLGVQEANRVMLHNFYHLFGIWPVFALGCELLDWAEGKEVC